MEITTNIFLNILWKKPQKFLVCGYRENILWKYPRRFLAAAQIEIFYEKNHEYLICGRVAKLRALSTRRRRKILDLCQEISEIWPSLNDFS